MAIFAPETHWVRRSFDRAAASYDAAAVLPAEVRAGLLERLDLIAVKPRRVLDAGAGTGHASRALKRRYPNARIIAVDSALGMLRAAERRSSWLRRFDRVCADAGQLPLAGSSVDLILSNLMLQWCDPDTVFAEFRRVLAPGGLLSFTSFGPETLRELRTAWGQVDRFCHVNTFIDMHDLGDALVRAGFEAPVLDVERYTLRYANVRALASDLKAMGASHVLAGHTKGLTTPAKFAAMAAAYEGLRHDGRLPATHEIVFGQAWAPAREPRLPAGNNSTVSLQEVKRQLSRVRAP